MSKKKTTRLSPIFKFLKKEKISLLLLIVIISFGYYLRIGGVVTNSFAFTYDVGRDLLQVQSIVNSHKVPLIGQTTGLGGLYYGPWWYYLLTPAFILSRGDPQGIAFFMVIDGIVAIILGFFLGVVLKSRPFGFILAFLISVSGAMIGFSNQIWNPNIAPTLVVGVLLTIFLLKSAKKYIFFYYLVIGVLLGVILDAEIVFGVLFISGCVLALLNLMRKKLFSLSVLGIALGFFIILSPRVFFEIRHNFVMTKSLFQMHGGDQRIFDPANFFNVFPDRAVILVGQFKDAFGFNSQVFFYIFVFFLLANLIFLWKNIKKDEKDLIISIVIILFVFLVGSSVFARAVWGHYLVGLPVLFIILGAIPILLIMRKIPVAAIILLFAIAYMNVKPQQIIATINQPIWEGNAAVYRNQLSVLDFIYKDAHGSKFNFIAYTPVVHDYTYRYLFSWYGSKEYGYIPSTEKQTLFYVIIEPDPGYEGRIKDWLKVREKDGKVLLEKTVKGGILVQKRNH